MSQQLDKVYGNTPITSEDKTRREQKMRIGALRYGGFFIPSSGPKSKEHCNKCGGEIDGQRVLINRELYHYDCFGK